MEEITKGQLQVLLNISAGISIIHACIDIDIDICVCIHICIHIYIYIYISH